MEKERLTFETFTDRYYQKIYWFIRRSVVDHDDAQDILQESFMKAYRHFWQLRDPASAQAWIYRIATNEVSRWMKKKYGRAREEQITEALAATLAASEHVDLKNAEAVALQKGMLALSPLQKEVFSMRYFDDLNYEQIAYITGSKVETLKVSWSQAKKIMMEYVQE
jgi:RNA polymerase sigma-70 factor (ECF subfamily)